VTIQATDSCQRSGHDHKLVEREAGSSKLCNTEQACATQHFSCNRPQQASAAKTRSISTEAATHKNGVLGRQTCQAAWWTDLPSPLASAITRLRHLTLDHRPGTSCPDKPSKRGLPRCPAISSISDCWRSRTTRSPFWPLTHAHV
jgi:hypothetical protein